MDSRQITIGLTVFSGLSFLSALILPLGKGLSAIALGSSAISMTGAAAISFEDRKWEPHRKAVRRSEELEIQDRLAAQHSHKAAVQEALAEIALFNWVMDQPAQFRAALLTEHDLWKYLPTVAVEAEEVSGAAEIGDTHVAMPVGLMEQASILQQKEASTELDVSWFDRWEERSGIICGESGDGKTKTLIYVLARFLNKHAQANQRCEVYIGDPDYGSSHGDAPPNNWLRLTVGKHIAINPTDIYLMILHVSKIVDDRAEATAISTSKGESKTHFDPVLFILDEAPAVIGYLNREQTEEVGKAFSNILRRGLKQNVTFKLGTQGLAVGDFSSNGASALQQRLLRQVETVILWRAAQVTENYSNLGIPKPAIESVSQQVATLPRNMGGRFVCAVFVNKDLSIRGIPTIGDISVQTDCLDSSEEAPESEAKTPKNQDIYHELLDWIDDHGWELDALDTAQEGAIAAKFQELSGKSLSNPGLQALLEYLGKL